MRSDHRVSGSGTFVCSGWCGQFINGGAVDEEVVEAAEELDAESASDLLSASGSGSTTVNALSTLGRYDSSLFLSATVFLSPVLMSLVYFGVGRGGIIQLLSRFSSSFCVAFICCSTSFAR